MVDGVTLDTIGGGVLPELFAEELKRCLANIVDPNTEPEVKRSIAIEVKFKPKKDREQIAVELTCTSKLAPIATVTTQVYVGMHEGRLVAIENDPRQGNFFDTERPQLKAVAAAAERSK